LIQLLPRLLPKSRVAVVGPTYQEHEVSWRRQGHHVTVVESLAQTGDTDVVVVVNPDNPTGRLLSANELCASRAMLVADESFIDFLPVTASLAGDLPRSAIVLRSLGKAYGLAGLRLGFAIAEPALVIRLRDELGPWSVSGPAMEIGRAALADGTWLQDATRRLAQDCSKLEVLLDAAGFTLVGSTPLFRLARHPDASAIAERLAQRGIHVRTFAHQAAWIRFGLPGSENAFERLAAALKC
jgi:cobalamin biosynthetic protein CobC